MVASHREPEFLSQGVNYLGFLAQQLGDLHGITTLAHELIQNADDAKDESGELAASKITFDLRDDTLLVSNDAVFRKADFERMSDVASSPDSSFASSKIKSSLGNSTSQLRTRPMLVTKYQ